LIVTGVMGLLAYQIISFLGQSYGDFRVEAISILFATWFAQAVLLYQLGKRRFATVDLFSSEILSLIRSIVIQAGLDRFRNLYRKMERFKHSEATDHFIDIEAARYSEDYFVNYHNNTAELGALSSDSVDYIVYFYTFMKTIREEVSSLWRLVEKTEAGHAEPEKVQQQIIEILYLMDVWSALAARSLLTLIEGRAHQNFALYSTTFIGAQANDFVLQHMPVDDPRYTEIMGRRKIYADFAKRLRRYCKKENLTLHIPDLPADPRPRQ
jgi:hypothetical protein